MDSELAEKAAAIFEEASTKHAVVIGDAPGKITDESRVIVKKANYAIILCREDCKEGVKNWQNFFDQMGVPVICVAISRMIGEGNVKEKDVIEATLVGLDRKPKTDEVIMSLALLVKERLDL